MAKKHWIYIKRGLSEDPKHRAQMGECIWLYMHIIDRADWETGVAFDWKDKEEAAEMSMPVDTLRRQRQKLEEMDYIQSHQKQHSQDVRIMEWRNPRDYGSEIKNPRSQGGHERLPSDVQGLNQGSNEGLNQDTRQMRTPTYTSKPKTSENSSNAPRANQIPEVVLYRLVTERYPSRELFDDVVCFMKKIKERVGREITRDDLIPFRKAWLSKGYLQTSINWLEWAETGQIPVNGKWQPRNQAQPEGFDILKRFAERHERQNNGGS